MFALVVLFGSGAVKGIRSSSHAPVPSTTHRTVPPILLHDMIREASASSSQREFVMKSNHSFEAVKEKNQNLSDLNSTPDDTFGRKSCSGLGVYGRRGGGSGDQRPEVVVELVVGHHGATGHRCRLIWVITMAQLLMIQPK
ncbi:hypothetical protein AXF42_Ash011146 [Apostasia shenzhenica]|uniref:Uncharacterized protein n=1 Tax=Apostasia shenzhenica TaxID=1088818 RepID=A0A2I0AKZ5_9ASPA|nr:hypothetical protein AXF42_Ash011146 [Apostasia shenzhenica]